MSKNKEFCDRMLAHLNQVAPVTARAMFGGYGLYAEGLMFALIADETLYFKADDENREDYLAAGSGPFVYDRKGKPAQMSYYQLPESVFNDLETLVKWVDKAREAAQRAKRKPKSKKSAKSAK